MKLLDQPAPRNRRSLWILGLAIFCGLLWGCASPQLPAPFDGEAAVGLWRTREIRSDSGMLESAGYYEWKIISKNNALAVADDIQWIETKSAPLGMPVSVLANIGSLFSSPPPPPEQVQSWDNSNRVLRLTNKYPSGETSVYLIHFKTPKRAELTVEGQGSEVLTRSARKVQ